MVRARALRVLKPTPPSPLPATRGDCVGAPRPCPYTQCRYHLDARGGYKTQRESEETCALDVADRGEHRPVDIAPLIGKTRQRVDQILKKAIRKAHSAALRFGIGLEDIIEPPQHVLDVPRIREEATGEKLPRVKLPRQRVEMTDEERQLFAAGLFDVTIVHADGSVEYRPPSAKELAMCVGARRARLISPDGDSGDNGSEG